MDRAMLGKNSRVPLFIYRKNLSIESTLGQLIGSRHQSLQIIKTWGEINAE